MPRIVYERDDIVPCHVLSLVGESRTGVPVDGKLVMIVEFVCVFGTRDLWRSECVMGLIQCSRFLTCLLEHLSFFCLIRM